MGPGVDILTTLTVAAALLDDIERILPEWLEPSEMSTEETEGTVVSCVSC